MGFVMYHPETKRGLVVATGCGCTETRAFTCNHKYFKNFAVGVGRYRNHYKGKDGAAAYQKRIREALAARGFVRVKK